MELVLNRKTRSSQSTIGELLVNGTFQCYILEDYDRGLHDGMNLSKIQSTKVYGQTAIPKGRYEVVITYSNRFKQYMPLLLNVKGFEGIRIHSGNTAADSLGCLLTGQTRGVNFVGNSRGAFKSLMAKLKAAEKNEKIFITIQ